MTREREFIVLLEGYLDDFEGPTPLPDSARVAIRSQLPSTRQYPAWWPGWRIRELNAFAKLSIAAAAVAVSVLVGLNYLLAPSVGGPTLDDPPATATPTPVATPTSSPAQPQLTGGLLEPGTYAVEGVDATITVPDGWMNVQDRGVAKGRGDSFMVVVFWPFPSDLMTVYEDPCRWRTSIIDPPVGPTVDDLAEALAAQAMRGDAVPTDVTVDGHDGKVLEMTIPSDIDFADCDNGEFRSWAGRYHQGPGQVDRVYILDVEGERQVVISHHMPGVTDADLAVQQAVFDSIDFLP